MTNPDDAHRGANHDNEARRMSLVTGAVAIAVSALVGLFLTAALNHWSDAVVFIVPVTLATGAIVNGPPYSAGRRLGWLALAVLAAGLAAGLIHQGASSNPYGG